VRHAPLLAGKRLTATGSGRGRFDAPGIPEQRCGPQQDQHRVRVQIWIADAGVEILDAAEDDGAPAAPEQLRRCRGRPA
jgi:hypothetical protein